MAIKSLTVVAAFTVVSQCLILHVFMAATEKLEVAFRLNASTAHPRFLVLDGDAFFVNGSGVQLTEINNGLTIDGSVGRVSYRKTIKLWNASTNAVADFRTHFRFQIDWNNASDGEDYQNNGGDGLSFYMAPLQSGRHVKYRADGGGLGVFDQYNHDASSHHQIVAVEFDTFKNTWDPSDNHVGIDVNNVTSVQNVTLAQRLHDGKIWDAWMDYRGQENILNVSVSCSSNGQEPVYLLHEIDLRKYLPENVVVGFSASAHKSNEVHRLISWSFHSVISEPFPPPPPPPVFTSNFSSPPVEGQISSKLVVVITSVCCLLSGMSVVFVLLWCARKQRQQQSSEERKNDMVLVDRVPRRFSYAELSASTDHFSKREKMGQGAFGDVYNGVLENSNERVAVKRISAGSKQGGKEYVAEINKINSVRHRNLVQLLGWCHERGQFLLIYEYMANGSLENYLFGKRRGRLDWNRRYKIASDIASALLYLHELWDECLVHKNVKSSNVMLDSDFNAKLGDLGLARLVKHDQGSENSTIAVSLGYMAPECAVTGISSTESDVFSFGAVALEIACGRPALDLRLEKHKIRLVEWVWDLYGQGRLFDAADTSLNGEFERAEMEMLMMIGLWCSHPDPLTRPTIRQVLQLINLEIPTPNLPSALPAAAYWEELVFDTVSESDSAPEPVSNSHEEIVTPVSNSAVSTEMPRTSTQARASTDSIA